MKAANQNELPARDYITKKKGDVCVPVSVKHRLRTRGKMQTEGKMQTTD